MEILSFLERLAYLTVRYNNASPILFRNYVSMLMVQFQIKYEMNHRVRKPAVWVSDQVRHGPTCTVIEECWKLETLDISSRGMVLSV